MPTRILQTRQEEPQKKKVTRAADNAMKPLAKMYLDQNPEMQGKEFPIFSGGITPKGYLLLRCKDFSVLLPGGTEVASILLDEILPNLHGKKANQLMAILNKGNRFGADIGTTDEKQVFYVYDEEQESFFTTEEKPGKEKTKGKKLTLQDFGTITD